MTTTVSAPANRWRAFALLAVCMFMTVMDLTIVNTAMPTIGRKLHFSQANLLWIVTAYGLTFGGLLLLGGRAADLLGRRRVLMAGLACFSAASLGAALASSEGMLIAMRAVQGIGAATILPAALSSVRNMFPEGAERNKALGIWGGLGAGGATAGLIFGGLLTRYAGWQYAFVINVPVGLAAFALVPRVVPESRLTTTIRRYDPLGALTVTGGLLLLVYAISQAPRYGWGASRTIAVLAAAVVALVAFVIVETRVQAPLMPLGLLRRPALAGANFVGFLLGASFYAFIFIGTLYLQEVLGYSPVQGGFAWLTATLSSIAFAALSQLLVTRRSPRFVMVIGMSLIGGGIAWATRLPIAGHYASDLLGPMIVVGIGTAFVFIPVSVAALEDVAAEQAGLASGLLYTAQELGGALGIAVASTVAASRSASLARAGATHAAALTGGFHAAFWVLAGIALSAPLVALLLVRRTPLPDGQPNDRSTEMAKTMISYRVKPEHAAENERLVRAVYEQLQELGPTHIHYATFKLDDGVSFVHVHSDDSTDGSNGLTELPAFREFQRGIPERCEEGPVATRLDEVGSFQFFGC